MNDPWADRIDRIVATVRNGPGGLVPELRQLVMDSARLPELLGSYVAKVAAHPEAVDDADIQALLAAGYTEDQIFEATVSAALGAGLSRLEAGLGALRGLKADAP